MYMSVTEMETQLSEAIQKILLDQHRKYPHLNYSDFNVGLTVRAGRVQYEEDCHNPLLKAAQGRCGHSRGHRAVAARRGVAADAEPGPPSSSLLLLGQRRRVGLLVECTPSSLKIWKPAGVG